MPAPLLASRRALPAGAGPVLGRAVLRWVLPAVVVLAVAGPVSLAVGRTLADVVVDPAALTGTSPLLGLVSHLGVLGWTAAGTAALLGASTARAAHERTWLRRVGVLSLVAALDDLLMGHDRLDAELPPSVPGDLVLLLAALGAVAVVATGRRWLVRRDDVLVLVAVAALFGASQVLDAGEHVVTDGVPALRGVVLYVEESLKLCGIALWLGFVVRLARRPG